MIHLVKTFIIGILLGLLGASALTYSVPLVDLHRESSVVSVEANGGIMETFRIDLPHDRIMVGLPGATSSIPLGLEWPGDDLPGNVQAEVFKLRNSNDAVIGVASRIASSSEASGSFIEWALHLPARGTLYLQMDLAQSADGYRSGTLLTGTRDFENFSGSVNERFLNEVESEDYEIDARIELVTVLAGSLEDEE